VKVLVTNCTRNSGLSVIRALAGKGCEVIGADYRRLPFGLRSRYSRSYELVPDEHAPDFADSLLHLVRRIQPDILIPLGGSMAVCERQAEFAAGIQCLLPPFDSYEIVNDKKKLTEYCAPLGISMPAMFSVDEAQDFLARQADSTSGRCLVVKPRNDAGGGAGVQFVGSREALRSAIANVKSNFGKPIITEYIPGRVTSQRAVQLLFDQNSKLISYFVLKKLRQWPAGKGISAAAISVNEPELVRSLVPLLESLRWQGPADAEFIFDAASKRYRLIEINPRFSGAIGFAYHCGVDFSWQYCQLAHGEQVSCQPPDSYRIGQKYITPASFARSTLHEIFSTESSGAFASARDDFSGPRVASVYQWSDPSPTVGKALVEAGLWLGSVRAAARNRWTSMPWK
jgi:predicted ATP-grasp superfamily ATP-dependent carboligase